MVTTTSTTGAPQGKSLALSPPSATHHEIPFWLLVVTGLSVVVNLMLLGSWLNRRYRG